MLLFQLGIAADTPTEFMSQVKEIVVNHRELALQAQNLQLTVHQLEQENKRLVSLLSDMQFE